jgi:predicted tellurium resistance membrane protein TerC
LNEPRGSNRSLSRVIFQIVLIDLVFSFDSVITAIGMTNEISNGDSSKNHMVIIFGAVIIFSIVIKFN